MLFIARGFGFYLRNKSFWSCKSDLSLFEFNGIRFHILAFFGLTPVEYTIYIFNYHYNMQGRFQTDTRFHGGRVVMQDHIDICLLKLGPRKMPRYTIEGEKI